MKPSGSTRLIISGLGFIIVIGITLSQPYLAFGAGRSLARSGSFTASRSGRFTASRMHHQRFFSHPSRGFVFSGVDGFDDQQVIIIQQFQSAPTPEARKPAETEFTSSHAGSTAGMELRSYSQDTGLSRKRQSANPPQYLRSPASVS